MGKNIKIQIKAEVSFTKVVEVPNSADWTEEQVESFCSNIEDNEGDIYGPPAEDYGWDYEDAEYEVYYLSGGKE